MEQLGFLWIPTIYDSVSYSGDTLPLTWMSEISPVSRSFMRFRQEAEPRGMRRMASDLESASSPPPPQGKGSLLIQRVTKKSIQNIPCQEAAISGPFALTKHSEGAAMCSEQHRGRRVCHKNW